MNKTNQFRTCDFFMAAGDILHLIVKDETGAIIEVILGPDKDEAPGAVIATDATAITATGFTANWLLLENTTGYYFNLATDPDMTPHIAGYENLDVGNVNHVHITGLTAGVTYYYQVSAYNDVGEGAESNVISTLLLSTLPLEDLDGNEYDTVVIGNQEWIVQNLKVTKYADGSAIPNITAAVITFDDWVLPSKDELKEMYDELHAYSVGDFSGDYYWSSSENNATTAWIQHFGTGVQSAPYKYSTALVRACRAFTSVAPSYSLRDVGPAGGLIFWKSGNNYLESAPTDQAINTAWSNITNIAITTTDTVVGSGQANTTAIIGQSGHTDSAAKLCDDLMIGIGGWINDTIGAYCWYDNDSTTYKADYGALYNWYAATNAKGLTHFTRGGTDEAGWRVPTKTDLETLIASLDGSTLAGAGGKLKETGTTHWTTPNTGADNSSGFTAVGSGWRHPTTGVFGSIKDEAYLWASTEEAGYPNFLALFYNTSEGPISSEVHQWGMAVRCVRDLYIGTVYVEYSDPVTPGISWRKGVRSAALVVDVTITPLGFAGTLGIDWINIKTTS